MTEARELAVVVVRRALSGQAIVDRLAAAGLGVVAVARAAPIPSRRWGTGAGLIACAADIASDASVETIAAALDRPVRMIVHGPGVGVAGGILSAPRRRWSTRSTSRSAACCDWSGRRMAGLRRVRGSSPSAAITVSSRLPTRLGRRGKTPR